MEFCKGFNARTQDMEKGMPCPVVITYYQDKSFTFEIKTPPASFFIKKAAKLGTGKKPGTGSKKPGVDIVAKITMAQCKDIAKTKAKDLNVDDLDQAAKMIAGTALDGRAGGGVIRCPRPRNAWPRAFAIDSRKLHTLDEAVKPSEAPPG